MHGPRSTVADPCSEPAVRTVLGTRTFVIGPMQVVRMKFYPYREARLLADARLSSPLSPQPAAIRYVCRLFRILAMLTPTQQIAEGDRSTFQFACLRGWHLLGCRPAWGGLWQLVENG